MRFHAPDYPRVNHGSNDDTQRVKGEHHGVHHGREPELPLNDKRRGRDVGEQPAEPEGKGQEIAHEAAVAKYGNEVAEERLQPT